MSTNPEFDEAMIRAYEAEARVTELTEQHHEALVQVAELAAEVTELTAERDRLQRLNSEQYLTIAKYDHVCRGYRSRLDEATAALTFYADRKNYEKRWMTNFCAAQVDGGEKARAWLGSDDKETPPTMSDSVQVFWCKRSDGSIIEHLATLYEGHIGHERCVLVGEASKATGAGQ